MKKYAAVPAYITVFVEASDAASNDTPYTVVGVVSWAL